MRRNYFFAGLLVACWLWGLAVAQGEKPDATQQDIGQLIQQLGAATFAEREQASKALEQIGEAALPALKEAAEKSPDAEIRRRASDLVRIIEARVAAERLRRPMLLSVAYHNTPVEAVIADLGSKTGIPFGWNVAATRRAEIGNKLVTLRLDQKPLWEVVDQVVAACGLRQELPKANQNPRQPLSQVFILEEGPSRAVATAYSGVARLRLLELELPKLNSDPKSEQFRALVELSVEPEKFQIAGNPVVGELRGLDKDGNPVAVQQVKVESFGPQASADRPEEPAVIVLQAGGRPQVQQVQVAARIIAPRPLVWSKMWRALFVLQFHAANEKLLAQLGGALELNVQHRDSLVIDNPLKAERKTFGRPDRLQLRLVEASRDRNMVKLVLERPAAPTGIAVANPNQGVIIIGGRPITAAPTFELFDEKGNPCRLISSEFHASSNNNGVTYSYILGFVLPRPEAEPARLVVSEMRPTTLVLPFQWSLVQGR